MKISTITNAMRSTTDLAEARELAETLAPAFSEALDDDLTDAHIGVVPLMRVLDSGMRVQMDVTILGVGCITVCYGVPASDAAECWRLYRGYNVGWADVFRAEHWTANLEPNVALLIEETRDDVMLRIHDIVKDVGHRMLRSHADAA